jgi:predicted secreted hydrolase
MNHLLKKTHFGQLLLFSVFAIILGGGTVSCSPKPPTPSIERYRVNPISFLSDDVEITGYTEARAGYLFRFPEDHGTHNGFKTEWWYFTGNLYDEESNHYGFQLTIFRNALKNGFKESESVWGINNVYMAHFTVTHTEATQFLQFEKFSRDSLGLAGGAPNRLDVWVEDWSAQGAGTAKVPIQLTAASADAALALNLIASKPIVLQGNEGFSLKSTDGRSASYYYSISRLQAQGEITVNGASYKVDGTAWMDHEWSSSPIDNNHSGWDWFALQLSDGSDLMYYQMRMMNGDADASSAGMLVTKMGDVTKLTSGEVEVEVLDYWQSPIDEVSYPSGWRIRVPDRDIDLVVEPVMANQELYGVFRYWEGAVRCNDAETESPPVCTGYVELTGY